MSQEDFDPRSGERRDARHETSRAANDQPALKESMLQQAAPGASSLDTSEAEAQSSPMGKPQQPEKSYSVDTRQSGASDVGRSDVREAKPQPAPSTQRDRESGGRQDNKPQKKTARDDGPRDGESNRNRGGSQPSSAANWKTLVLIAAISIVCGAAGAWAMSEFTGPSKAGNDKNSPGQKSQTQNGDSGSSQSGKQKSSGKQQGSDKEDKSSSQGGASASDIPGFTSADDAETLKKQIKHLADRLEQIDRRLDQVQKPETDTPPVVHTLQIQIAELSKEVDQVANLPAQFRRMEHRVSAVEQEFKTLRDELSADDLPDGAAAAQKVQAARGSLEASQSSAILKSSDSERSHEDVTSQSSSGGDDSEPAIDESAGDDATMKLGTELFQQGKYAKSREVFRRLQRARPHDARVWYYTALANGLLTRVWDGKTERLFEKGRECELAGDPPSEQIDAAFADLKQPEAKQRLEDYRGHIQEHSSLQQEPDQIENERPAAKSGSS